MTKAQLEQQLAGFRIQQQQLRDNANALSGAIQFGEMLLAEMTTEDLPVHEVEDPPQHGLHLVETPTGAS